MSWIKRLFCNHFFRGVESGTARKCPGFTLSVFYDNTCYKCGLTYQSEVEA